MRPANYAVTQLADDFLSDWIGDYDPEESKWIMCKGALRDLLFTHARTQLTEWMMENSFATGHGDTLVDLLKSLTWQIAELRERARKGKSENG